jgi:hypothetical protein
MLVYWRVTPATDAPSGTSTVQQGSPLHGGQIEADLPVWLDGGDLVRWCSRSHMAGEKCFGEPGG